MGQGMTVRERIRSFVTETFFVDDFSDEELFLRAGIIDSMGMLQLVAFLQEQFGIEILDEDLVPTSSPRTSTPSRGPPRSWSGSSTAPRPEYPCAASQASRSRAARPRPSRIVTSTGCAA